MSRAWERLLRRLHATLDPALSAIELDAVRLRCFEECFAKMDTFLSSTAPAARQASTARSSVATIQHIGLADTKAPTQQEDPF